MTSTPKTRRGLRLVETPAVDPMTAWREFKPNTQLYARLWLETGELPASCHFVIAERLAPWIAAVTAAGPEMRNALLEVVPPIPIREQAPTRTWIMPSKTYAADGERENSEDEPATEPSIDPHAAMPQKPLREARGGVTNGSEVPEVIRPDPAAVTPQESVVAFPLPEGSRTCGICRKVFKPYRENASFCSNRCRQKAYRERLVLAEAAE